MKTQKGIFQLCDQIRETAYALHHYLRHGHLEKVYENGLANRPRKAGVQVKQQHALQVLDEDETVLGDYLAGLMVDGELIVELKACKALTDERVAQLLGYLRGCRIATRSSDQFRFQQSGSAKIHFKRSNLILCFLCLFAA
jgi:GxxExxY protein